MCPIYGSPHKDRNIRVCVCVCVFQCRKLSAEMMEGCLEKRISSPALFALPSDGLPPPPLYSRPSSSVRPLCSPAPLPATWWTPGSRF